MSILLQFQKLPNHLGFYQCIMNQGYITSRPQLELMQLNPKNGSFDQAMNNAAAEVISYKRMILHYREETT